MCGSCPSQSSSVLFVVSEWLVLWCDSQKRLLTGQPQCMTSLYLLPVLWLWSGLIRCKNEHQSTVTDTSLACSRKSSPFKDEFRWTHNQFTIVKCSSTRPTYDLDLHQSLAQHRRAGSLGRDSAVQQNLNEQRLLENTAMHIWKHTLWQVLLKGSVAQLKGTTSIHMPNWFNLNLVAILTPSVEINFHILLSLKIFSFCLPFF